MNKTIWVIVFGGGTNAIGQIRAAAEAGYKCINVVEDCIHKFSAKSNKCQGYVAPHPYTNRQECLDFTFKLIKALPEKPYLFCASDEWMDMIGENEDEFKKYSHIVQSPWKYTEKLYNKKELYRLAEEYGVPYPKTLELNSIRELNEKKLEGILFPCIVKPQVTVSQNEVKSSNIKTYHRTLTFDSLGEMLNWVEMNQNNQIDYPILVQEFIPGNANNLYTLTSYSDKEGKLIAGSIGYKLRQFPPEAGRITSGVLRYDEDLKRVGELFLKTIKYNGVANTEFKYDARDKKYKLMEINTRFGAWNYSTLYSGINLMEIAINDYNGVSYKGPMFKTEHDGYIWYNFAQDFGSSVVLNRKEKFKTYKLSIGQWYQSIKKNGFEAIFDKSDLKPFFFSLWYLIRDFLK